MINESLHIAAYKQYTNTIVSKIFSSAGKDYKVIRHDMNKERFVLPIFIHIGTLA